MILLVILKLMFEIQETPPSHINFKKQTRSVNREIMKFDSAEKNRLTVEITFDLKESGSDVGESGGSVKGISLKKAEKWDTW